ncbi:MAG TPA: hypothetical protein VGF67_28640 [Ktedonobacteraceae bacterium]
MQIKNIPEGEEYLDNITRAELSAIDFKNVQTEEKLLRENISGNEEAARAHYFIGDQVRKAIEAMQAPYPEDLPSAPSIRRMVEERQRAAKKRVKKSGYSHPWERSIAYRYSPLLEHVAHHRGDIIAALLIMVRAWHLAGRPLAAIRDESCFGPWKRAIGAFYALWVSMVFSAIWRCSPRM